MNPRVAAIAPSVTLGIAAKAKAITAAGRKVFSFAAGEPDFDTPEHIKAAAIKALNAGEVRYTAVAGMPALCKAIAAKLETENGIPCKPEQIIVSNGAKQSLYNLFLTLLSEGDEVIVPAPFWLSYPEMIAMAGGQPVYVHCEESNDFKMTPRELELAITSRTRAVVINSPSNPVGSVYTPDELRAICEVAAARGLYIVADEIYEKLVYEDAVHVSPASFSPAIRERTITVNGFSKAYAMTGWRLGYLAGPLPLVKAIDALQSHSTSGPNTFAQFGALEALRGGQDCVRTMAAAFDARRRYMYDRLVKMPGVTCVKPRGAFYMLPNIAAFGLTSVDFCEKLITEQAVAAVPGSPFGVDANIRLSYACGMDDIREGLDRLEAFCRSR